MDINKVVITVVVIDDSNYKFVPDDNSSCGTLHIKRSCGHVDHLYYGGAEFAERDVPRLLKSICWPCHNSQKILQLKIQLALKKCKQAQPH